LPSPPGVAKSSARPELGDSLTVEQPALTRLVQVRILVPQPAPKSAENIGSRDPCSAECSTICSTQARTSHDLQNPSPAGRGRAARTKSLPSLIKTIGVRRSELSGNDFCCVLISIPCCCFRSIRKPSPCWRSACGPGPRPPLPHGPPSSGARVPRVRRPRRWLRPEPH
jgi:hypothetical protein